MTQARDGVFAAEERQQDAAVEGTEEVEALVVASSLGLGWVIAEGCGRDGDRELTRFLNIASGSAAELDYQLLLARSPDA